MARVVCGQWEDALHQRETCMRRIETTESKLNTYSRLVVALRNAEVHKMESFCRTFNEYLNAFLARCFDEPIQVMLVLSMDKGDRQKAKFQVQYKNMPIELSMLSNGEFQRVLLGAQVALAWMLQSPLLILDEITSHLDEETSCRVYEAVQSVECDTCLVVAHNTIQGIFPNTCAV